VLHRLRAEPGADRCQRLLPLVAFEATRPNLDQFVRVERAPDLRQHGVAESFLPQLKDRIQRVCPRFQRFAFGGGQW